MAIGHRRYLPASWLLDLSKTQALHRFSLIQLTNIPDPRARIMHLLGSSSSGDSPDSNSKANCPSLPRPLRIGFKALHCDHNLSFP